MIGAIILQVILIALNAVFTCAETAIVSLNDNQLEEMAKKDEAKVELLSGFKAKQERFLTAMQLVSMASVCLGSAYAALVFRTAGRFYWKKRTGNKSKCIGWTLCHCNFTCIMHCNDDFWTYGAKTFGSRKRRRDGSSFFFYCLCGTDCLFSANLAFNCRVTYASSFMWC